MVAQKCKKKLLTKFFGIFECLLTQNLTNQDSKLLIPQDTWQNITKSKHKGLYGITST